MRNCFEYFNNDDNKEEKKIVLNDSASLGVCVPVKLTHKN